MRGIGSDEDSHVSNRSTPMKTAEVVGFNDEHRRKRYVAVYATRKLLPKPLGAALSFDVRVVMLAVAA